MKCSKDLKCTIFKIDYKKSIVKFKPKLLDKKVMSLKEFAMTVLGIEPVSNEIIAMYLGKLGFDTYNKGIYKITFIKKIKHGIRGKLMYDKDS